MRRQKVVAFPAWRRWALAAVIAFIAVATFLAIVPSTRDAIAGWLGVRGVFIVELDEDSGAPVGAELELSLPVTLEEAREQVDFDVLLPALDPYDQPDEVYLSARPLGGMIFFVYQASDDLPLADESGVGMLISQFRGDMNPDFLRKESRIRHDD